jgi:hypothetical protein
MNIINGRFLSIAFLLAISFNAIAFTRFTPPARPYKVYTATLTQQGEDAPTVVVMENTLGVEITWSRMTQGMYAGRTSIPVFPSDKTFIPPMRSVQELEPTLNFKTFAFYGNTNTVNVQTLINNLQYEDGLLRENPIEIRVYPE